MKNRDKFILSNIIFFLGGVYQIQIVCRYEQARSVDLALVQMKYLYILTNNLFLRFFQQFAIYHIV